MDVRCPKCGEPWDIDSLHDEVGNRYPSAPWMVQHKPKGYSSYQRREGEPYAGMWHDQQVYETYFEEVRKDFRMNGCAALSGGYNRWCEEHASKRYAIAGPIMDFFVGDIDAAAEGLEDAESMGLFE